MTHNEFNPFTGRLKKSTRFQPLYPLNPSILNTSEQKIIWDTMMTKPAEVKSQGVGQTTIDPKLLEKYSFFQKDLNKPVYRLAGGRDKILYGVTLAIMSVALVDAGTFLYELAKKN
ncbi:uncharacterized protein LOC124952781 [Vespa velutina]|uniref:uncharacterized protein LOC124952781 n=1 Tax=Vespa velutina TaxID=202808 RepID=UPI001FB31DE9|nr:uncharacterized protein LOC124952781 [Vespa velutina]